MSVDGDDELVRVGDQCHSPHALMAHDELMMTCCTRKVQNMSVVSLDTWDPSQNQSRRADDLHHAAQLIWIKLRPRLRCMFISRSLICAYILGLAPSPPFSWLWRPKPSGLKMSPKISDQRLGQATTKIVRRAAQPGGLLEREEFTMAVARRLIAEEMGAEEIVLKEGEMKSRVKVLVQEALVRVPLARQDTSLESRDDGVLGVGREYNADGQDQIGQEEQESEAGPSSTSSPPISKVKRARKRRESSEEGSGFDDAKDDDAVVSCA